MGPVESGDDESDLGDCCLQLPTDGEDGEESLISFMLAAPISSSIHGALTSYTTWQFILHLGPDR